MTDHEILAVNAKFAKLVEQRNEALNQVVELSGKLAVANSLIEDLTENGSKLVSELEESNNRLSSMSTIVGLL